MFMISAAGEWKRTAVGIDSSELDTIASAPHSGASTKSNGFFACALASPSNASTLVVTRFWNHQARALRAFSSRPSMQPSRLMRVTFTPSCSLWNTPGLVAPANTCTSWPSLASARAW